MKEQKSKVSDLIPVIFGEDKNAAIAAFTKVLATEPDEWEVVTSDDGESEFIAIEVIESKLDTITRCNWSTKKFQTKTYNGYVTGNLELTITHPVTGKKITKLGASTVPIELRQTQTEDGKVITTHFADQILIALCTKNAAKKFGKWFGRSLNRMITDLPNFGSNAGTLPNESEAYKAAITKINECTSVMEIQTSFDIFEKNLSLDEVKNFRSYCAVASSKLSL